MTHELNAEYEALLQFMYMAPVGLIQMDVDGNIAMINPVSAQLLLPITPHGDLTNFFKTLENVAPELESISKDFKKKRGTVCDSLRIQLTAGIPGKEDAKFLSITMIKLDVNRLMTVITDVTLQVKREKQLQHNEAWFNAIFSGVSDYAIASLDKAGKIESWNVSIERLTKFTADDVKNKSYAVFFPEDSTDQDRLKDRLCDADENGWNLIEGWCLRKDGSKFWGSSIISPLVDALSEPLYPPRYSFIIRDIEEKRQSAEDIIKASFHDHLTGLANRRAFFDAANVEFSRWKRKPRPLSVIAIDADFFKKINDEYGHGVGDNVLKHLAASIQSCVRSMDLVARIGGEEFIALLPSIDLENAMIVAERIRSTVSQAQLNIDGLSVAYTVSLGVCSIDESVSGIDELIKRADIALYESKTNGRNRVTSYQL